MNRVILAKALLIAGAFACLLTPIMMFIPITALEASFEEYYFGMAVWSPDGKLLTFVTSHDARDDRIYLVNEEGEDLRPITDWSIGPDIVNLLWSEDGSFIHYCYAGLSKDCYAYEVDTRQTESIPEEILYTQSTAACHSSKGFDFDYRYVKRWTLFVIDAEGKTKFTIDKPAILRVNLGKYSWVYWLCTYWWVIALALIVSGTVLKIINRQEKPV